MDTNTTKVVELILILVEVIDGVIKDLSIFLSILVRERGRGRLAWGEPPERHSCLSSAGTYRKSKYVLKTHYYVLYRVPLQPYLRTMHVAAERSIVAHESVIKRPNRLFKKPNF